MHGHSNIKFATLVVSGVSKLNTNCTKDVNNETLTLNPEPREESLYRGCENYFYHGLLLSTHCFIWVQFNNLTSILSFQPQNFLLCSFIFLLEMRLQLKAKLNRL
jgi:hypothetical protein